MIQRIFLRLQHKVIPHHHGQQKCVVLIRNLTFYQLKWHTYLFKTRTEILTKWIFFFWGISSGLVSGSGILETQSNTVQLVWLPSSLPVSSYLLLSNSLPMKIVLLFLVILVVLEPWSFSLIFWKEITVGLLICIKLKTVPYLPLASWLM